MDLRNNRITVGEILQNPRARALLFREFPMLRDTGVRRQIWNMPLWRVLQLGGRFVSQNRVDSLLRQLRSLD
ncbi:hypothetical protein [Agathobaculum sp.]|uniref:hypothetical protein n=1 Tax=Agathobaculum sp. TaxID=2048138 RepID=UPI002A81A7A0|nr:hypothetical protein [Agathobaculum sp.]MDY3619013.1 hypothetical protein [Agathobaculum sp.]